MYKRMNILKKVLAVASGVYPSSGDDQDFSKLEKLINNHQFKCDEIIKQLNGLLPSNTRQDHPILIKIKEIIGSVENILFRRQSYHVEIYAEKNKHGELNPYQMTSRNWRKYIDKVACQ